MDSSRPICCPHCSARVVLTVEGECPACRKAVCPPCGGERDERTAADSPPSGMETSMAAQFSVRGALWFTVACSVYCSQFVALPQFDSRSWWRSVVAIFVAWLVLGLFLLAKGVRGMIVAHCFMPVVVLFFGLVAFPWFWSTGRSLQDLRGFIQTLAIVCLVSSSLSFPASVVRMVCRAVWRRFGGARAGPSRRER